MFTCLARGRDALQTHLAALVRDHDTTVLALLLEGVMLLAHALGYNPIGFLAALGVLTDDEIVDYVATEARRNPPDRPSQTSGSVTVL